MRHPSLRVVFLLAVFLLLTSAAWRLSPAAQSDGPAAAAPVTFKTLANFGAGDGEYPNGFLSQASDGNYYGTTAAGGTTRRGVLFKMTPGGAVTTLHDFDSSPGDGWSPASGLIQGTDGSLYGTTANGGAHFQEGIGGGAVYEFTLEGALTTLYSFCAEIHCADGNAPYAGLVEGLDGDFYGTTVAGGIRGGICSYVGCGTVFQITPQGMLTTLHSFCTQLNCADGAFPPYDGAPLLQDNYGNFYGTTLQGGTGGQCSVSGGCGTLFRVSPEGSLTTVYSFCSQPNCTDGSSPVQMIQAEDGDFYGQSVVGSNRYGMIFKITPQGALTTLYSFCALPNCADGTGASSLIQATDGNFYGTTTEGGTGAPCAYSTYGCGTVFKLTPTGVLTTLYSFCPKGGDDCPDGEIPGGLIQGTDGSFYGETLDGGASTACYGNGCGTAFNLSVGLKAFVETQTAAGSVGSSMVILGSDLTGATSVTFNGVAAAFTVVSSTEITATVPTGATTGPVYVTTPSGTLKSNKNFHVAG